PYILFERYPSAWDMIYKPVSTWLYWSVTGGESFSGSGTSLSCEVSGNALLLSWLQDGNVKHQWFNMLWQSPPTASTPVDASVGDGMTSRGAPSLSQNAGVAWVAYDALDA